MKASIQTLGCKVNLYESNAIAEILKNNNYEIIDFKDKCDLYIINTCTVTNTADSKSRKIISQARRTNPDAIVIAIGCYTQMKSDEVKDTNHADIIIGTNDKLKIMDYIKEYKSTKSKVIKVSDNVSFENYQVSSFNKTRAFVKIQDGCNNFCSYCIIPFARGRERSKPLNDIIKEVELLGNNGYKEIVLSGINLGRYGKDLDTNLYTLISNLVNIANIERIRISSIEVNEITNELIELISNNKKIVKHLHVPLQSGTNEILKLMNRKYDINYYVDKVNLLRNKVKGLMITTDLIVGFPGETDELFNETKKLITKLEFLDIHVFPYSKREGTKAAIMEQVQDNVKKERVSIIRNTQTSIKDNVIGNYLNKELEVLLDTEYDDTFKGYTNNFIPVELPKNGFRIGDIVIIKPKFIKNGKLFC